MITVQFNEPADNGGDPVTEYIVRWDNDPSFNSLAAAPHKGQVSIDKTVSLSHTIEGLTEGATYYVKVSAVNLVGEGPAQTASPTSVVPAAQVPGKPSTVSLLKNGVSGELVLSWSAPIIPAHGIFCSSADGGALPAPCPTGMSVGTQADGGMPITAYLVQWDISDDFNSGCGGVHCGTAEVVGGGLARTYTLTGLSTYQTYYARVIAYNGMGQSPPCRRGGPTCSDGAVLSASPAA